MYNKFNTNSYNSTAPKWLPPIFYVGSQYQRWMLVVWQVEPSHQYSITFCCCVTDGSKVTVWRNGIWHGSTHEAKVWNWIPVCRENGTHWHSLIADECLWRPKSGCEHSEDVGGAFWQQSHERQATFQMFMHSCHTLHLDQLICTNQWIVTRKLCRDEYQFQCVGNNGGNIGILQFVPAGSRECSH